MHNTFFFVNLQHVIAKRMDSYQYKITVGYPVYNVEKYVYKSLKSILDQDFIGYEVIMFNDCSDGNTMSIVQNLSIDALFYFYRLYYTIFLWKFFKRNSQLSL